MSTQASNTSLSPRWYRQRPGLETRTAIAGASRPGPKATKETSMTASAVPLVDAIQPVEHETRDRIITGLLTVIPFLMLGFVVWQLAGSWLHWSDLVVFALIYIPT